MVATVGCLDGGEGSPTPSPTVTATPTESPTATPSPSPTTGPQTVDVAVGPERRLRFDPDAVEIAVEDTVRWTFESAGHNVTTKPGASEKCEVPADVEPFSSYEGDRHFDVMGVGTRFEHTFTVPGTYVYVCAPHADQGMVGTVEVTDGG